MNKFMITALAAATMLNNAHAVRVLSSEQATLEKNGREVARAFREIERPVELGTGCQEYITLIRMPDII